MYLEDLLNKHNIKIDFINVLSLLRFIKKNGLEYDVFYNKIDYLKDTIINQRYMKLYRWNKEKEKGSSIKIEFDLTLDELELLKIKTENKLKYQLMKL